MRMKKQCNQKDFCLTCKKSYKRPHNSSFTTCPNCHSDTIVHISYKSRAPKVNASKKKWKEFYKEIYAALVWYWHCKKEKMILDLVEEHNGSTD